MFRIVRNGDKWGIHDHEAPVLDGISVTVRLSDATEIPLALQSVEQAATSGGQQETAEYALAYADAEGNAAATVTVRCEPALAHVFLSAEVRSEPPFGQQRYLADEDGVILRIASTAPIDGLMANYQHKDWWTRPVFDRDPAKLPDRTLSLLFQSGERYYHLLPVTRGDVRSDLRGGASGLEAGLSTYRNGFDRLGGCAFVLGAGTDPFELARRTAASALASLPDAASHRENKEYPEILDYFGWCSWDAFYHQVHADGLADKLKELNDLELPVPWVMIDDGWLDVRNERLNGFEADKAKFPDGLAGAVRRLKERHGVRWVGVWHTIMGYWAGIEPTSALARDYKEYLLETQSGKLIPYPEAAKAFGFWNAWHSFLKKQGIDFVKVDGQSSVLNFLRYYRSVGEAARAAHTALEASAALHFNRTVINCMGMGSESVWSRPVTSVSRNSDDFMPKEERSFREHALQNAYNSWYHGQFYWGDWDMFWTVNPDGLQNGVLRALSGGPVYISDPVGRTDPAQVWPLIFRDGKIARADRPGMPTADCLLRNPTEERIPLKVWNTSNGVGIVAAFHVNQDPAPVAGTVRPSDVPGLRGERFVVYDYFRQSAFRLAKDEASAFELADGGVALYVIVPADDACSPIGLLDKYIPSAAIERQERSENRLYVRLREGGRFGFASDRRPSEIRVNGEPAEAGPLDGSECVFVLDCAGLSEEVRIEILD